MRYATRSENLRHRSRESLGRMRTAVWMPYESHCTASASLNSIRVKVAEFSMTLELYGGLCSLKEGLTRTRCFPAQRERQKKARPLKTRRQISHLIGSRFNASTLTMSIRMLRRRDFELTRKYMSGSNVCSEHRRH